MIVVVLTHTSMIQSSKSRLFMVAELNDLILGFLKYCCLLAKLTLVSWVRRLNP